ncbi:hypothetical protein PtA15_12A518 [Puccinia triticina]|uniref:Uncharacterized protein n=1 Tax=Puccinia triticina TaxID=208348 RepID=A0ABY7D043_9BASI|nr:uncharacterized protein PtA15_12A518 [Puccinia triticina]WAQ90528.1 hypothetical protein PtA15_12A518 [Puccinia triticina]
MNNSTTPTNGIVVTPEMWQQMQSMLALFQTAKSAPAPASLDQQTPAKASNQPSQITSASNLYCNSGSQESDDKSALDNSGFKNKKKESTAPPNKQSTPIIDTQVAQSPSSKKDQDLLVISDLKSYDFSVGGNNIIGITDSARIKEAAGIEDSVLAIEDAPAIKDAPASEDTSDSKNLLASKHAPAIEDTPDIEDAAAIQENEASPSEEAVKLSLLNERTVDSVDGARTERTTRGDEGVELVLDTEADDAGERGRRGGGRQRRRVIGVVVVLREDGRR